MKEDKKGVNMVKVHYVHVLNIIVKLFCIVIYGNKILN